MTTPLPAAAPLLCPTAAGRGYSDLAQHPIFPWVVADWTSDVLDLSNPATFRDLAWPIAAQTEAQVRAAAAAALLCHSCHLQ